MKFMVLSGTILWDIFIDFLLLKDEQIEMSENEPLTKYAKIYSFYDLNYFRKLSRFFSFPLFYNWFELFFKIHQMSNIKKFIEHTDTLTILIWKQINPFN